MLLIPSEKRSNERDSFRKAREAHIIQKAKILEPLGINKRDGIYSVTMHSVHFLFSVCLSSHTIPRHIICTSAYYFTTCIFCEFVSCPSKPDED